VCSARMAAGHLGTSNSFRAPYRLHLRVYSEEFGLIAIACCSRCIYH
jgi:hypothetical protein